MHKYIIVFLLWGSAASAHLIEAPNIGVSFVQNSSGINWKIQKSKNFELIYPDGHSSDAQLVLSTLEYLYEPVSESLKVEPAKIPIILQPRTLNSNGFVTLAPRRSEFFTTPLLGPQLGLTEWLRALSVHEFRHVVQFEKSKHGFARALYFVLGEIGSALAMGLTIPPWYFEGDAVGIETALSKGGRGRLPLFDRDMRALLLDDQEFSYDQMALGSFKRYRPNHYVLGYFLTSYIRIKFGKDSVEKIHWDTMERAYNPLAFYWACEKYTGVDFDQLYKDALADIKNQWKNQIAESDVAEQAKGNVGSEWVNYSYPFKAKGKTIAFRQSLSDILQVVDVENDNVLWTPTRLVQEFPYKLKKGKLAYSQTFLHPRFGVEDYSNVIVRDIETQKIEFEKNKTKWTLPVLSHQADKLAFVNWANSAEVSIGVWDLKSDSLIWTMNWPRDQAIVGMDWSEEQDSLIILHRMGSYTHQFVQIDLKSKTIKILASSNQWNWSFPSVFKNEVYFQSPQNGIDNIYRLNLDTKKIEQVTNEKFGAYHPSLDLEGLTFSTYTPQGLKPITLSWPLASFETEFKAISYAEDLTMLEGKGDLLENIPLQNFKEDSYSQAANSFNPHSWILLAPPFSSTINAEIRSTNLLNTLNLGAGAQWDLNEKVPMGYAFTQWSYLWPVFDFRVAYGNRRSEGDLWEEGTSSLGMTLPYISLHSAFIHSTRFRLAGELLHASGRSSGATFALKDKTLGGGSIEWNSSLLHRQAQRDLLPPWGISLRARAIALRDIESPQVTSSQELASAKFYTTPIFKHHHLYAEISQQKSSIHGYRFPSEQLFARGYVNFFLEEMSKQSYNYTFPLAYPEWSLGEWLYVKRLSLNMFYDRIEGERFKRSYTFESHGAELWLDTHFVRNAFNIQWGIRYNRPNLADESIEIFLNTGVASF
jgi:hypothetical protein